MSAVAVALRAVGLLILLVLTWKILARGLTLSGGGILAFIHGIDLIFHEAGHVIFGFFGDFIGALGGSLNQVLIPAVCAVEFLRRRAPASAAVAIFWMGESIVDVAIYVHDGRAMALPLLAEGLTHDWNYLLARLGLLNQAEPLGRLVFVAGVVTLVAALTLLAGDLVRCWRAPDASPDGFG